jgi:hypothetical protein
VVSYLPPYRFEGGEEPAGQPLAARVVLVLVDGLRLDASRGMPFLNALRARGADLESSAAVPSYSRPGRASLVTGAWSEIHGATTNFHDKAVEVDNLFRAAAAGGRTCAVAGSLWKSLFGPDLARAHAAVTEPTIKDEPGKYFALEPGVRAFGSQAAAFLKQHPAELNVADVLIMDYAAHEFGGRSEEYARSAERSDGLLQALLADLDLGTTAVVVTSDHGHLDEGGHGGGEPEVLAIPLVLAGKGVKAGVRSVARQIDVAPTIAALLGLPLPRAAQGRVLIEALDLPEDQRLALLARQWQQRRDFARGVFRFLGTAEPAATEPRDAVALAASVTALEQHVAAAQEMRAGAERGRRLWPSLAVWLAVLIPVAVFLRRARTPALVALLAGVLGYLVAFRFLVYGRGIRLALSAINHEDDVEPYFARIAVLAALAIVLSMAVALWVALRLGREPSWGPLCDLALGVAGTVVGLLAAFVALLHWRYGLFMEWEPAELGWGFLAFVSMVQIQAVSYAALVAPPLAWLLAAVHRRSPVVLEREVTS